MMRTVALTVLLLWPLSLPAAAAEAVAAEEASSRAARVSRPDDPSSARPEPLPPWRLGVALGYGARSNPLIQSDDIPIVVDLDVAWFGERWFFDNGDLGINVTDNRLVTLSLIGRVNSDRVFFGRTDTELVRISANGVPLAQPAELEVPDRDYAVEAGLEMLFDGPWGLLQLAAHHDAGGTHGGYEVFAEWSRGWRAGRWHVEPAVGVAFKSRGLNDYYWGVRPRESNEALPAYRAGSGVNPHARLLLGYHLSRHWSLSVVAEYERLNGEAAVSPIVADRDVVGYFAGIGYRF